MREKVDPVVQKVPAVCLRFVNPENLELIRRGARASGMAVAPFIRSAAILEALDAIRAAASSTPEAAKKKAVKR